MKCLICGKVIASIFPIHTCAVPPEMEGAERYVVWADPKNEAETEMSKDFDCLEKAVIYARGLPEKYSASCIVILATNDEDEGDEEDPEDTSFSMKLDEINQGSTLNLQRKNE